SETGRPPMLAHGDRDFSSVIRQNDAARYLASSSTSVGAGGAGSIVSSTFWLGAGGSAGGGLASLMDGSRRDDRVVVMVGGPRCDATNPGSVPQPLPRRLHLARPHRLEPLLRPPHTRRQRPPPVPPPPP